VVKKTKILLIFYPQLTADSISILLQMVLIIISVDLKLAFLESLKGLLIFKNYMLALRLATEKKYLKKERQNRFSSFTIILFAAKRKTLFMRTRHIKCIFLGMFINSFMSFKLKLHEYNSYNF